MDSQYPDPAYQDEIEAEKLRQRIAELERSVEYNEELLDEASESLAYKNAEIQRIRQEKHMLPFQNATPIKQVPSCYRNAHLNEGIVISEELQYRSRNPSNNKNIETFNWFYSKTFGLIRALNQTRGEPQMEFGRWYYITLNDSRRRKNRIPNEPYINIMRAIKQYDGVERRRVETSPISGKLWIHVSFNVESDTIFDLDQTNVEDEYLKKVTLNAQMKKVIRDTVGTKRIQGAVEIETIVEVKKDFLQLFLRNKNAAIFQITEIVKIKAEVKEGSEWNVRKFVVNRLN